MAGAEELFPRCPLEAFPQHFTSPVVNIAHGFCPCTSEAAFVMPVTPLAGELDRAKPVVPSPHCPWLPSPQHFTLPVVPVESLTQVILFPAITSTTLSPGVRMAFLKLVRIVVEPVSPTEVPSPNSPLAFEPEHQTSGGLSEVSRHA